LRAGQLKVIDAPTPELYDLESDPFEQRNVFEDAGAAGVFVDEPHRGLRSWRVRRDSRERPRGRACAARFR